MKKCGDSVAGSFRPPCCRYDRLLRLVNLGHAFSPPTRLLCRRYVREQSRSRVVAGRSLCSRQEHAGTRIHTLNTPDFKTTRKKYKHTLPMRQIKIGRIELYSNAREHCAVYDVIKSRLIYNYRFCLHSGGSFRPKLHVIDGHGGVV